MHKHFNFSKKLGSTFRTRPSRCGKKYCKIADGNSKSFPFCFQVKTFLCLPLDS